MDPASLVRAVPLQGPPPTALLRAGMPPRELALLLALVGQELDLVLLGTGTEGIRLRMPDGQVVTAQGELPFPEGTQLRVKVSPAPTGEAGVRFQTLQARPASSAPILAPLFQGESAPLMARLHSEVPPAALEPLVRLMQVLVAAEPSESLPGLATIRAAVEALPAPMLQALARTLGLEAATAPADVAKVFSDWMLRAASGPEGPQSTAAGAPRGTATSGMPLSPQVSPAAAKAYAAGAPLLARAAEGLPAAPRNPAIPQGAADPLPSVPRNVSAILPADLPRAALLQAGPAPGVEVAPGSPKGEVPVAPVGALETQTRAVRSGMDPAEVEPAPRPEAIQPAFLALTARAPEVGPELQDALGTWFRHLLGRKAAPETALPEPRSPGSSESRPGTPTAPTVPGRTSPEAEATPMARETLQLQKMLDAKPGPPARLPESWETWIRGTAKALADPAASPREAPFHALQSLDRTSFFELPLPWAPQTPLHLWVEADGPEGGAASPDPTTRILLGTSFSRLGEARIGLEKGPAGLRARIWVQHPELLEGIGEDLETELKAIEGKVDLRILPLEQGPVPSLRSLAAGSSLHAMG